MHTKFVEDWIFLLLYPMEIEGQNVKFVTAGHCVGNLKRNSQDDS